MTLWNGNVLLSLVVFVYEQQSFYHGTCVEMDICWCLSIKNKKNEKDNWRNRGERGFIAQLKHQIEKNCDWGKKECRSVFYPY